MTKKPIYSAKTKDGDLVEIFYPTTKDAKDMYNYVNKLSKEKTFMIFQGEKVSLADEEKYLTQIKELIKKKLAVVLFLRTNGELAGVTNLNMMSKICSHIGSLGISIKKEFRGRGLGELLMKTLLTEGKKAMPQLKIVKLGVFAINPGAIHLYKKLGFKEYGRLPKGLQYKGKLEDEIFMYKNIK
jgi:RimJ/RimL family protein N-acetyltransferase